MLSGQGVKLNNEGTEVSARVGSVGRRILYYLVFSGSGL